MKNNDIKELYLTYNEALNVLRDKFQELQKSFSSEESPISYIKTRLKTEKSTKDKLEKKLKLEYNAKTIEENLYDIAGIRIVCPFLSDTNKIIEFINDEPDIEVIEIKNYIKEPKPSGYSSYHMLVLVPVTINGETKKVKAEIQIRTMAMDVIASIDHKIKYKKDTKLRKEHEETLSAIVGYVNILDSYMDTFIQEKRLSDLPEKQPEQQPEQQPEKQPEKQNITLPKEELDNIFEKHKIALDKVTTTMTNIKEEYLSNGLINPIEHIKGRIKKTDSIILKLMEKGIEPSIENIEKYITDIAAIKIVCSFKSDVDKIIEYLNKEEFYPILDRQDYITEPKECGYSSYHFVVAVPIEFNGRITFAKTEIQVRTIIMDFWAKIEHILCYKKEVNPEIKQQLKCFASALQLIEPQIDELAKTIFEERETRHRTRKREIPKQVTS